MSIYKQTHRFPKDEMVGLTSQIRRSAVSIPSNIAEGYGRKTTLEYVRFLYIAYGSVFELETQAMISGDLGYVEKDRLQRIRAEIGDFFKDAESDDQIPGKQILESLNPRPLGSYLATNWEKNHK